MTEGLEILPVRGIGDVTAGDDLAELITRNAPWLRDGGPEPPLADDATFRFVSRATFEVPKRGLRRRGTERVDVRGWLRHLRASGAERVLLVTAAPEPEGPATAPQLAAFSGGVAWGIVASGPRASHLWRGHWQTIPEPLYFLHHILPMSYALDGMRQLMYGGLSTRVTNDVLVLLLWLALALFATSRAARKQRVWSLKRVKPELSI